MHKQLRKIWTTIAVATVLAGCGSSPEPPPVAETCGDYAAIGSAERLAVAQGMVDRVGDDVEVAPGGSAFAGQLDAACAGNESFDLARMAATVITVADSQGVEAYDQPLP